MNTDLRKKNKNNFEKETVFGKTMENLKKNRYETCHNKKKKELFGVRTKLPCYKVFHRIFNSNRNEKKSRYL